MDELEPKIIKSLEKVWQYFWENELAFLALTTKIELPFRDRWAFLLFSELRETDVVVAREWQRIDLAILKRSIVAPAVLVELKAMYTFDAVNEKGSYKKTIEYLKEDIRRAQKFAFEDTNIYGVLLATHPKQKIPDNLAGVVKYKPGINSALTKFGSADKVKDRAAPAIEKALGKSTILGNGMLPGGFAFGIETDILYWIIK